MSISENKFLASLTGEKKYSRCLVAPFNEKITKRNGKYKSWLTILTVQQDKKIKCLVMRATLEVAESNHKVCCWHNIKINY